MPRACSVFRQVNYLHGCTCKVLSLDDLINVKSRMKRPKDLIVLEELIQLKNDNN